MTINDEPCIKNKGRKNPEKCGSSEKTEHGIIICGVSKGGKVCKII